LIVPFIDIIVTYNKLLQLLYSLLHSINISIKLLENFSLFSWSSSTNEDIYV